MRLAASTALILMACQPGGDDQFPIAPGGGDPPVITPAPDGPPADTGTDGGTTIAGRVCVILDPRNPTMCAIGNASGITVALGTSFAVTAADGSFTIDAPLTSNLLWGVSGVGFVPTVMPLGTVHRLPLISEARYSELLLDNDALVQEGQGSLFLRAVTAGVPAADVTATVEPASVFGPLYDGANLFVWDRDATSTGGMVWIPDALAGTATLVLTGPSTTPVTVAVPVVEGAITFATLGIP
jgi:hypothetical protein